MFLWYYTNSITFTIKTVKVVLTCFKKVFINNDKLACNVIF